MWGWAASAAPPAHRECEQHPGQVGRSELEESEKGHADVLVPPTPYVHHHKCERGAQEGRDVYEGGAGAQKSTAWDQGGARGWGLGRG